MMRAAATGLFAAVAGVVGGLVCLAFGAAFDAAGEWYAGSIPFVAFALPLAGVAELALYRILSLPADMGMADVARAARRGEPVSPRLAPAVFAASCMSAAFGASVGKEAAAAQLGASAASCVREAVLRAARRVSDDDAARDPDGGRAALCGMAAGVGALLVAPVSGALFAIENARRREGGPYGRSHKGVHGAESDSASGHVEGEPCSISSQSGRGCGLCAALVSSLAACGTVALLGGRPFLPPEARAFAIAHDAASLPYDHIGVLVLVALACFVAGAVFVRALRALQKGGRQLVRSPFLRVAAGGALLAALLGSTGLSCCGGSGFALLPGAFTSQADASATCVKIAATLISLGLGFKGGSVMPVLASGALLGSLLGGCAGAPSVLAAACGMLAFFASASRCPLTACAMAVEFFIAPSVVPAIGAALHL